MLLIKLLATPLLTLMATLVARRFGPALGGVLVGLPLTTGPVSALLAVQHGPVFARETALASLVGQVSTGLFCLGYAWACRRFGPALSAAFGLLAFAAATLIWSGIPWTLPRAAGVFAAGFLLIAAGFPETAQAEPPRPAPRWELALRMILGGLVVLALSSVGGMLGARLSGLIAPMPVIVLILAVFTQISAGRGAATILLRGVVVGSPAFGAVFVTLALALPAVPLGPAYAMAAVAGLSTSALIWRAARPALPRTARP